MLHLGSDAGLELLHLVYQRVNGVVLLVQRFALARAHRHMPGDILAGIGALVHALVASLAVNAGATLYEVQDLLGHSSAQMTQRYAHLTDSGRRAAVGKVGGVIREAVMQRSQTSGSTANAPT